MFYNFFGVDGEKHDFWDFWEKKFILELHKYDISINK